MALWEGADHRVRYLLSGFQVDAARSRVEFTKNEQDRYDGEWKDSGTERDVGLEWKLLQKVDPDAARKIEAEADAEGEKAREK